jgi:uncharacterized protein YuzE
LKWTYDDEADALYVYLRDGHSVARSVVVDEDRVVDVGPDDSVIGIEVLGASEGVQLLDLVDRFGLEPYLGHLRKLEAQSFQSVEFA